MKLRKSAFLLGADNNQLEYLDWMLKQLKKVETRFTIIVANFGIHHDYMPPENCDLIPIEAPENLKGWFLKPYALKAAHNIGYEQVCWLDNDLELLDNIDDIFDHSLASCVGMSIDEWAIKRSSYTVWNSGVVLSSNAHNLLQRWAMRAHTMKERGDQEALAHIANVDESVRSHIYTLPAKYNWQRLMGEPTEDVKVRHWTGPKGKKYIREILWK
jgi:hypothetical protein